MPNERFMRHHYGASGYVEPSKTVRLPDEVSVKMLQNEVAVLERQRDELLAALKLAARVMEAFEIGVDAEIRAAIANAEAKPTGVQQD